MTELDYLKSYLELMDKAATKGHGGLSNRHVYDSKTDTETDEEHPLFEELAKLNAKALEAGVSPKVIRKTFILQDALTNDGSWYSSTVNCAIASGYREWP